MHIDKPVLPTRKRICHVAPVWITDQPVFFITICCEKTNRIELTQPESAAFICDSFFYRQKLGQWHVHYLLLMPDHLHTLLSFGTQRTMKQVISNWKHFASSQMKIAWQRDFFDHRIRSENSFADKWEYIRQNPVRKGLIDHVDEWPYSWTGQPADESPPAECGGHGVTALP